MAKKNFSLFQLNRRWLVGLAAGFVLVWFLFFDTHSLLTRYQLEQQKQELIKKTEEYRLLTAELEGKIEQLDNDPALLEKIARENYGMKKPDRKSTRLNSSHVAISYAVFCL